MWEDLDASPSTALRTCFETALERKGFLGMSEKLFSNQPPNRSS
jgi:hypothetical protein